jgi:hypothetical protein
MHENETVNLDQYSKTMELLDFNPKLAPVRKKTQKLQ